MSEQNVVKIQQKYVKKYKCPYCDKRYERNKLITHIEKNHEDMIPKDYTATRVVFNLINKKTVGHCTICGKETKWNEDKARYERLCGNPACKKKYMDETAKRLYLKHGKTKEDFLNDPEFQERMLANRSISGKYKFQDGGVLPYVGSYEKTFLEFMDQFFGVKSDDLIAPGPVIDYEYNGKAHKWITDFYYEPYNLVFDIKDGGDNPNTRDMKEYREKQIAKEKAIAKTGEYNYIRLTDNKMDQMIELMMELKESLQETPFDNSRRKVIIRINESTERKRSELDDSEFGIPSQRKYPLDSEAHVRSAIKFFNYVDEEHEEELAKNIIKAMKKYGIDDVEISDKNRLSKYIKKKPVKENTYINEEAVYDPEHKYPMYIVAMHSGTPLANIIKKVTKDEFSHVCVSFNDNLNPFYSFGSKEGGITGLGLTCQKVTDNFYKKHKAHYKVFVMFVTKKQKMDMKKRLEWFLGNDDKMKYDFVGLIQKLFNKATDYKEFKYFCSRFVAEILNTGTDILNKAASLYTPQDVANLPMISFVNGGEDFSKYNEKITKVNLQKIKQGIYTDLLYSESYSLDIDKNEYKDSYEFYSSYLLREDMVNPEDVCWDYSMYSDTIEDALMENTSNLHSGNYYVYTDLGCGKTKYIGTINTIVTHEDMDLTVSYKWVDKVNRVKEIFEDCAAMVGTGNNFFNNGEMMGRTFEKEEKDFIETSIFKDFYKIKQKRNNNTLIEKVDSYISDLTPNLESVNTLSESSQDQQALLLDRLKRLQEITYSIM